MQKEFKTHLTEIISDLSDKEFEYIMSFFETVKRRKHQFIVQEGDLVHKEYWVVKGCLKAYFLDKDGKEHIVQFATENWWITDYNAFFKKEKATIFIDCLEDCELLSITLAKKEQLCSELHKMEHFWRVKLNFGYVALQKRILSLLRLSANDRYEQLIGLYPSLVQRVPKKLIASFLGVSRETLSRFKM